MSARHLSLLGAAAGAIALAAPATAQSDPPPEMPYEYAYPAAPGEIEFRQEPVVQPVVQPLPAPPPEVYEPPVQPEIQAEVPAEVEYYDDGYDAPYQPEYAPEYDDTPIQPPTHHDEHAARYPDYGDRSAWMDDCRARYRGADRRDGATTGGVIGAVAGGVIGNRVADGDRLAGTLIGAGAGGLAGLAIGSAVDSAESRARIDEYCEAWFDSHTRGPEYAHGRPHPGPAPYTHGYGHAYPAAPYGHGYPAGCACGYPVTYVPVLVQIPQRAVVREYVTEEWVTTERPAPVRQRKVYRPAPTPDKRIKYRKTQ